MSSFSDNSNNSARNLTSTSSEAITNEYNRSSAQTTDDKAKATDHKKQVASRIHRARILRNNAKEQSDRGGIEDAAGKVISSSSTNSSKITHSALRDGSEEKPRVINWTNNRKTLKQDSKNKQQDQPLVHTDQLNTTSPLLYVSAPNESSGDNYQAAESRVAILAATYKESRQMDNAEAIDNQDTERSESGHQTDALTPRLVVINLEVGSSSATITWALSLHQLTEKVNSAERRGNINDSGRWPQIIDSSPLEPIEGVDNKRVRQQKRHSASNNTVNNTDRQHWPNEIKVTSGNATSSKLVNAESSNGNNASTTVTTFTGPQIDGNSSSGSSTISTTTTTTTTPEQANRFIVKRDTIKVTPALKQRKNDDNDEDNDEAEGVDSELHDARSSTTPDIDILLKASVDNESSDFMRDANKRRALAESDKLDKTAHLSHPADYEQDLIKMPQASRTQADIPIIKNNNSISSSSRLDLQPKDELQRQVKNSSSLHLNEDLTINRRLQLGRLANNNLTLSSSSLATNRRPPIRNQSHQGTNSSSVVANNNRSEEQDSNSMQYESSTPHSYIASVPFQKFRKLNATSSSTMSPASTVAGPPEHHRVAATSSTAAPMRNSATTSRRKAKLLSNSNKVSISRNSEPPMIKVQAAPLNRISSTTPSPSLNTLRNSTSIRPSLVITSSTTTTTTIPPLSVSTLPPSLLSSSSSSSSPPPPTTTTISTTTTKKPSVEHWSKSGETDFSVAASSISDQVGTTTSRSNLPAPEKNNQLNKAPTAHQSGKEEADIVSNRPLESTTKSSTRLSNHELNVSTQSPASVAKQLVPVLFQKTTPKPNSNLLKLSNGEIHSPTSFTSNKLPTNLEQNQIDVSKWFIRLRRFASNEVDIVKVVVNNISQSMQNWSPNQKPVLRYISFKNLEPSSAYEICIESASPNQQVGDKFQILDANHFLKCHDSTDVELHNITTPSNGDGNSRNSNDVDDDEETINRRDIRHMSEEVSLDDKDESVPSGRSKRAAANSDQSDGSDKMKSLCKEFFTLPLNSADKINFGQVVSGGRHETTSGSRSLKPVDLFSVDELQLKNYSNVVGSQLPSLRRPKSLNNKALKSHIELLEISDLSAPNHANSMFEITASSSSSSNVGSMPVNNNKLSSIASDTTTNYIARDNVLDSRATEQPFINSHRVDFLNQSVIPIVGCVFGLIFIITLANILLNAISCRTSSSSSPSTGAITTSRARRRRQQRGATGDILDRTGTQTLNSFYSDNSDHSNTSQSRIVVVGKSGEPFATTSAYFEVPMERACANDHLSLDQASSSGNSSRGKHSSSYLLAADKARFPLGPSFEGDEKHNADMVGLARKNYDNFINHIYNADTSKDLENNESPNNVRAFEKRPSHRHHHHHHHISRQQMSKDSTYNNQVTTTGSKPSSHLLDDFNRECESERYARAKKQRIRFDKINPIYNMDGLYTNISKLNRRRSPMNQISSFGHTNSALIKEEDDDDNNKRNKCSSNDEVEVSENYSGEKSSSMEQCPFCEQTPNIGNANEVKQSQQQDEQQQQTTADLSLIVGCDVENCENGSYFTCCLDKQKQRFHKQQQQLEKVMTKNGSLVPQPFINPSGPPRCASPTCESIVRGHEQISAEPTNDLSMPDLGSNSTVKVQESIIGNSFLLSQQERSDQEIIELKGGATIISDDSSNQEQRTFFVFGEIPQPPPPPPPLPAESGPTNTTGGRTLTSLTPSTPKEPQPNPPEPVNKRPVVSVEAMGSNSVDSNGKGVRETIDKTDFDQRRNQLASKLQLAGMVKPG